MNLNKTVKTLLKKLFSEISYQQLITDIGHAANTNCFYDEKMEHFFELITKMDFPIFLKEYKKAWLKRDKINRQILIQLKNYSSFTERKKIKFLLRKMYQLRESLTYLFALLCFMDTTGKRGFINIYIERLDQLLQSTSISSEERLCLLTPIKGLSFYSKLMVELYQLKKQMSENFGGNPCKMTMADRKLVDNFAKKYFNGVTDIVIYKLLSIKENVSIDVSQIMRQFSKHKKQYIATLQRIEKELTILKKESLLKEIRECLNKIETILYYDHVYEPRRRVKLALGDLLVRYLAVSLLFKKKLITLKHPYLVPQNEVIKKLEGLV